MKFVEILDKYAVPYLQEGNRHCRAGWLQLDCPYCGRNSGKFHLGYNLSKGYLSCWKCRGHPLAATLSELTGESVNTCRELLGELELAHTAQREARALLVLPKPLLELSDAHKRYLERRELDPDYLVRKYDIAALDLRGRVVRPNGATVRLPLRVFIPIKYKGETVSWTTRTIQANPDIPRYISAPADCERISAKQLLYNEDNARFACCAVEGPIDAWKIGDGAVALCGTAYTRAQVLRLSRFNVRLTCFDTERTAQQLARELVTQLCVFDGETYNVELDSKDPGSATARELAMIREALHP